MAANFGKRLGLTINIKVNASGASAKVGRVSTAMKRVEKRALSLRRGLGDLSTGFSQLSAAARPFIIGGTIAGLFAVREVLQFNKSVKGAESALGGMSQAQKKALEQRYKYAALDRDNNASLIEAAQAGEMLAHSGILTPAQLDNFLPVVLQMHAVDAKLAVDAAAKSLLALQKSFAVPEEGVRGIADQLARAADLFPGNISDMTTAMRYMAPAAQALGVDSAHAMALAALTIKGGLVPSQAGTGGSRFLMGLADPKKAKLVAKTLGKYLKDGITDEVGRLDLEKVAGALEQSFEKGMAPVERAGVLKDLFDQRGMRAAIKLIVEGRDEYEKMVASISKGMTLQEKSTIVAEGYANQLEHIKTSLSVIAVDFVEKLFNLDTFKNLGDTIEGVARAFSLMSGGGWTEELLRQSQINPDYIDGAVALQNAVEGVKSAFSTAGNILAFFGFNLGGTAAEVAGTTAKFLALTPIIGVASLVIGTMLRLVTGLGMVLYGLGRIVYALYPIFIRYAAVVLTAARSMLTWSVFFKGAMWASMAGAMRNLVTIVMAGFSIMASSIRSSVVRSVTFMGFMKAATTGLWGVMKGAGAIAIGPLGLLITAFTVISSLIGSATDKAEKLRETMRIKTQTAADYINEFFPGIAPQLRAANTAGAIGGFVGPNMVEAPLSDAQLAQRRRSGRLADASLPDPSKAGFTEMFNAVKGYNQSDAVSAYLADNPLVAGQTIDTLKKIEAYTDEERHMMGFLVELQQNPWKVRRAVKEMGINQDAYLAAWETFGGVDPALAARYYGNVHSRKAQAMQDELEAAAQGYDAAKIKAKIAADITVEAKTDLHIDGGKVGSAISKKAADMAGRGGAEVPAFQRARIIKTGALPIPATGR